MRQIVRVVAPAKMPTQEDRHRVAEAVGIKPDEKGNVPVIINTVRCGLYVLADAQCENPSVLTYSDANKGKLGVERERTDGAGYRLSIELQGATFALVERDETPVMVFLFPNTLGFNIDSVVWNLERRVVPAQGTQRKSA